MSGLEIESITPVADNFSKVIIGKILHIKKHPDAERLNICEVDVGNSRPLTIVSGADNVKTGIKVPAAVEGAELPNNLKIEKGRIRGELSEGMLCSAVELGLAEKSEGIFIFPDDAEVGLNVWEYLKLSDDIMDVAITPNRGDCLSVMGLAKDIAAITDS